VDNAFAERNEPGIGAEIMGRGKFARRTGPWTEVGTDDEWRGWWGANPPFHTPVFVMLTSAPEAASASTSALPIAPVPITATSLRVGLPQQ
jgi:hypothetical protein